MPITAFDTETELIRPGAQAPRLACLSWQSLGDAPQIVGRGNAQKIARDLLEQARKENPLVGHNVAFDMCVLAENFPSLMPLIFEAYERDAVADTRIRHKLIDIANGQTPSGKTPYALATLAEQLLGKKLDKDTWRLRYGEFADIPLASWPQGALEDAASTLAIYQVQALRAHPGIFLDHSAQCRADFALRLASNRGIITDPGRVAEFVKNTRRELEEIQSKLVDTGLLKELRTQGIIAYVRDTKKAQLIVESALGKAAKRTPTGRIQVDEDSCVASKDERLLAYNRYSKLQILTTKECQILDRGTREPIHTNFNVLVNTGRTSSSNPNLQNPRREPGVRECFTPRSGYAFASADYAAAELHTLAQVCLKFCGFSTLAQQLNAKKDPHLALAADLLLMSYADAQSLLADGNARISETRQMAKAANFGFPGGMGAGAFQEYAKGYGFNLSFDYCELLREKWFASYPEMKSYFRYISQIVGKSGRGEICHLYSRRRRGGLNFTAACNSFFQGLAADGAKRALFEVQKRCHVIPSSTLFGSFVVNFVHDEIIIETPEAGAHLAAQELAQVMISEFNKVVPDVPVSASPLLMRFWSKKAIPLFNSDGHLIPWEGK